MACPRKALGRLKACFLTVTSIQTREALGTRPTLGGGIWACRAPGPPPPTAATAISQTVGFQPATLSPLRLLGLEEMISPIVQKRTQSL